MCCRPTGMHYESAGREVQAAGSAGGSHAEGAEVSPTTEGTRHLQNLQHSQKGKDISKWSPLIRKSTIIYFQNRFSPSLNALQLFECLWSDVGQVLKKDSRSRWNVNWYFTLNFPSFKYQTLTPCRLERLALKSLQLASLWRKLQSAQIHGSHNVSSSGPVSLRQEEKTSMETSQTTPAAVSTSQPPHSSRAPPQVA